MSRIETFERLRSRLFGIAYRMLGTRADAEDAVQDVWLRSQSEENARSDEAWLVAVTTRLCIDRLRAAKVRREAYQGAWLPEPLSFRSPEEQAELSQNVSIAFLVLLERLGPEERAAFLLHHVLGEDYPGIAAALEKSEATVRQMVSRARDRIHGERRFDADTRLHRDLIDRFLHAVHTGDETALRQVLTPGVTLTGDGGGKVPAAARPISGADRVTRFYLTLSASFGDRVKTRIVEINGEPAVAAYLDGRLNSVAAIWVENGRIGEIYTVLNPDKLANLGPGVTDPEGQSSSR